MIKKTKSLAVVIVVLVILAGAAGVALIYKQPPQPSSSVNGQTATVILSGTVTRGPITPTCNDNQPCYSPVASHTIQALDSSGNIAATTLTSDTGKYSMNLKPGHYTLKLVPQVGSSMPGNDEVDVADTPKEFNLTIDSGIR